MSNENVQPDSGTLTVLPIEIKHDNTESNFSVHGRYATYIHTSCTCFGPSNSLRYICVWIVEWSVWELVVNLVVISNIILLLSYDYGDRALRTERNRIIEPIWLSLSGFFIAEVVIKVIALGVYSHTRSYLRSGWNILDLIIVFFSILDYIPWFSFLYGMNSFRALRCLKIAYTYNAMKRLLEPIILSLQYLPKVLCFLFVLLLLFSLIGVHQFRGDFYYRCRFTPSPINNSWEIDRGISRFCSASGYGDYQCPSDRYCGHPSMFGIPMDDNKNMAEVYYGAVNYDNVLKGLVGSVQVITFDNWADLMYKLSDTMNSVFARIFFPVLVFIGAFFSLNLIVAVIVDAFQKSRAQIKQGDVIDDFSPRNDANQKPKLEPETQREQFLMESGNQNLQAQSNNSIRGNEEEVKDNESQHGKDGDTVRAMLIVSEIPEKEEEVKIQTLPVRVPHEEKLNNIILCLLLCDMICLALDRYGISKTEVRVFDAVDSVFTAAFILEMLYKIVHLGFVEYLKIPINISDLCINILGLVEVGLTFGSDWNDYNMRGAAVLLRLTRLIKFGNKWKPLGDLISLIASTMRDIINFLVLLILFIFIYAIIGMELYCNNIKINDNDLIDDTHGKSPRFNFDNVRNALLSTFTLVIGENWTLAFYTYSRINYPLGVFYFYSAVIILNIFLVNLFLAIVLQNYFEGDEQKNDGDEQEKKMQYLAAKSITGTPGQKKLRRYTKRKYTLLVALRTFRTFISLNAMIKEKRMTKKQNSLLGRSFFFFSTENSVRIFISGIVKSLPFNIIIYCSIIINSVSITFYSPLYNPEGGHYKVAFYIDICLTVVFVLEIILKMVCFGVIFNGPDSYLLSVWNILDLISTLSTILYHSIDSMHRVIKQIIMVVRVLRVFRVVTANEGFRLVIRAIGKAFPSIMRTLAIMLLFFFVVSIIGIHFFKGRLYYCDTDNVPKSVTIKNIYDCVNIGGEWVNNDISFDNILMSLMTMFELLTGKFWWLLVNALTDSVDIDMEPIPYTNPNAAWFVVACMIIGFLFLRAVLSGIVNLSFSKEKEELQGLSNLTSAQKKWVRFSKIIFKATPLKVYQPGCRLYPIYQLITHKVFQGFITSTILVNVLVFSLTFYDSPEELNTFCEAMNFVFAGIYTMEAVLKIIFYRFEYFLDGWNRFDFVIALGSVILLSLDKVVELKSGPWSPLLNVCIIMKLLSLFRVVKYLRKMYQTVVLALPSIANLALLFLVVVYAFSVLGISLFSEIKLQVDLNYHANFQDFQHAFLTVFRMATADGWNNIMHDMMRSGSQTFECVEYPTYADIQAAGGKPNGCGVFFSPIFCILFMLVVTFIFLNLFIAIVVGSTLEISELSESVLSDEILDNFQKCWAKYDPDANGMLEYSLMWKFLCDIGSPLGTSNSRRDNKYYAAISLWMLELKIYHSQRDNLHYVEFFDVLEALVKKTIYCPQTLYDIYNNNSKETLVQALQSLWDQKGQLNMDDPIYLNKIEDLNYYYDAKRGKERVENYKMLKVQLPLLVWITLRIMRTLKNSVKKRKEILNPISRQVLNTAARLNFQRASFVGQSLGESGSPLTVSQVNVIPQIPIRNRRIVQRESPHRIHAKVTLPILLTTPPETISLSIPKDPPVHPQSPRFVSPRAIPVERVALRRTPELALPMLGIPVSNLRERNNAIGLSQPLTSTLPGESGVAVERASSGDTAQGGDGESRGEKGSNQVFLQFV